MWGVEGIRCGFRYDHPFSKIWLLRWWLGTHFISNGRSFDGPRWVFIFYPSVVTIFNYLPIKYVWKSLAPRVKAFCWTAMANRSSLADLSPNLSWEREREREREREITWKDIRIMKRRKETKRKKKSLGHITLTEGTLKVGDMYSSFT